MAGKHRSPDAGTTYAWDESTGSHRALAPIAESFYFTRGRHAAPPSLDPLRAFIIAAAMLSAVQLLPIRRPRSRSVARRPAFKGAAPSYPNFDKAYLPPLTDRAPESED